MSSPEGSSVTFRRVPASLRRAPIERFARTLQKGSRQGPPFDTLITGDAELRRLNRDFRGKDYPYRRALVPNRAATGVPPWGQGAVPSSATLPSPWGAPAPRRVNSATPSSRKSRSSCCTACCTCVGHDHETDAGAMARAEKRWRAKLGLPNGLIERVRS